MDLPPTPESALLNAIELLGSQAEMARVCGISQPAVWKWVDQGKQLPPEYVLRVEAATGVPRHQLRPDLYPPEEYSSSPGTQPDGAPAGERRKSPAGAGVPAGADADANDPLQGLRS